MNLLQKARDWNIEITLVTVLYLNPLLWWFFLIYFLRIGIGLMENEIIALNYYM